MRDNDYGRSMLSYVIAQSALVLVVLAGSYLAVELIAIWTGWQLSRLWVSLAFILLAQLPVAVLYVRHENRDMTASESWTLGAVFVVVSMGFEAGLQVVSGDFLELVWVQDTLPLAGPGDLFAGLLCMVFLSAILVAFMFRVLVQRSVKQRMAHKRTLTYGVLPRHKARKVFDAPGHYRRELFAMNIGVFGLAMIFSGPVTMELLRLSIPISILFGVICVANQIVKSDPHLNVSGRCLKISLQLLPLTLACVVLLVLAELRIHEADMALMVADPVTHMASGFKALMDESSVLMYLATAVGFIAALCLAGNTMLLILFARLIRPMVIRVERPKVKELLDKIVSNPKGTTVIISAAQVHAAMEKRRNRTPRPSAPAHSFQELFNGKVAG